MADALKPSILVIAIGQNIENELECMIDDISEEADVGKILTKVLDRIAEIRKMISAIMLIDDGIIEEYRHPTYSEVKEGVCKFCHKPLVEKKCPDHGTVLILSPSLPQEVPLYMDD
jgi:hypothetical protein